MALLNYIIGEQGFERVRDLIVAILTTEFANQESLDSDPEANPKIFSERYIPMDKEEMPAISVRLSRGNIDSNTTVSGDGDYKYLIDVYAKGKTKGDAGGDISGDGIAAKRLHKMMGRVMVILEDPQYRILGLTQPAGIGRTGIEDLSVADPVEVQEGTRAIHGRLIYGALITDVAKLLVAVPIDGFEYLAELGETGDGHQFSEEPSS